MTKTMTEPVCMYFTFAKSTSIKDEDLEGTDKIRPQYVQQDDTERYSRKIPLFRFRKRKRTVVGVTANVGACLARAHACD